MSKREQQRAAIERFSSLMQRWEQFSKLKSDLRRLDLLVPKIAMLCVDLSDDEVLVVIEAIGEIHVSNEPGSYSPARRVAKWFLTPLAKLVLENAPKYDAGDLRHAEYYALLAPSWNALNGLSDNPAYAMRQAMYKFRSYNDGTSTAPLRTGDEAAEQKLNLLIGWMINSSVYGRLAAESDLEWFGSRWREVSPVWKFIKDDDEISRDRAETAIKFLSEGGSPAIMSGLL